MTKEQDKRTEQQQARDTHPPDMPAHQIRRDNQDYYDRIDPDRRRFRFDE